ncbi:pseudouridine synthase [Pontibacter oryzae]|uniref:Pseudouridine synthase n=1 Tax=Pontibacter oryzae TaxID=2304593 RepID=A0A399S795_9BACT|nr:pseudouridine synthase [Pontibacter oryzae]RIJ37677.1 pseudouridine synthase [Pontibacter oryzae]
MAKFNERPDRANAGEGRRGADRDRSDRPNNDREGKKIFNRRDKHDRSDERGEGRERRPFNDRQDRRDSDRKPFNNDRREGGERRSFGGDRREGGERRSFNPDRREGGDRRSYGDKREGGERRSFGGDRREGGERRSFQNDRPRRNDGERRSYGNDRRDDRRGGDDRGNDRRFSRDGKPAFGDKRGPRDDRGAGRGKDFSPRGRSNDRYRDNGPEPQTPDYNLSRYKNNPRIKKSNREEDENDGTVRLNRYIANAGVCSRREADVLIESGEIKVNGEVVTEMGYKVQPTDNVYYGKKLLSREKMVYVLLNKPKDFLTTTDDPEGRKTVMSLVASASKERIFPVGRLDRNTTGLLLFTNDGEVAQKLTHPSNNIKKIYQVELDKPITKADFQKVAEGVELEDGKAEVDDVALLGESNKFLGLEIHIGRNRIVRRIFESLGYDVVTLDRVQYAGLTKKDVPRGEWRYLTEKEVIQLKYFM